MVIAHLPAGYLLTKLLQQRLRTHTLLWAGLLGSIFPDLDIFYFYLIDDRQTMHRQYWTHLPFFWLCCTCVVMPLIWNTANIQHKLASLFFLSNVWLHLCLDTVMAPIYWLQPFSGHGFQLLSLNVERIYDFWMWNYMLHPVFILELIICLVAGWCWAFGRFKVFCYRYDGKSFP